MPVVSLVHTKGGVAKTTSAVYLAAAAHRRGIDVELVDADPQGSALEWAADARGDQPLPFPVVMASRPLTINPDRELTIVDTPPGTAQVIQEAIDIADLVVVPTGASPLDVRRVWPTLEITAHRLTAVLLTGVDLRTRLADEVRSLLENEGVPVIGTPIVRREDIRRAYGITPTNLHGYDDVLTELMEAVVHV
ncbi:MAG TPA: ParA family protein [Nitrospira sp.]|nr:ParA family protein [Mycobacterium sp.]TXH14988.1 MAG: ParA family protein [Gammaproteobacteria bacterium]HNK15513.1 ParA family protein [Nitrospira sp.]HNO87792.1 ParA family protein [Rhodocyclaceae bacterium]MCB0943814.1 ParA family protein [Mycobacterium sp.]